MLTHDWARSGRFALGFTLMAVLGRLMLTEPASLSLVWPAAGVAMMWLAGTATRRDRILDGVLVLVIATVAAVATGASPTTAVVLSCSALAGAVCAALVLRHGQVDPPALATVQHGQRLLLASLVAGVASVLVVAAASLVVHEVGLLPYGLLLLVRTMLGSLIVGALVLAWRTSRPRRAARARWFREVVPEVLVTTVVLTVIFVVADGVPVAFAAIPVTLWVALRADVLRSALHVALAGTLTVAFTLSGSGPFFGWPVTTSFLLAQAFIAVVAATGLGLALVRSERLAAVSSARSAAARLRSTVDSALIAHVTVRRTPAGPLLGRVNPAATAFLRCPADALTGRSWLDLVAPSHRAAVHSGLAALGAGDTWQAEVLHVLDDGSEHWAQVSAAPMVDGALDDGWLTVQLLDVTSRKEVEDRLAHMALHDDLTGLANRILLQDRIEQALVTSRGPGTEVALLFFDLDHFKTVNDSLGHAAGDQMLLTIAGRLRGAARAGDTVARIGGDEFVVCCPGVSSDAEAQSVADRMLEAVAQDIDVGGRLVTVTFSGGLTLSRPGSTASDLLRESDAAMYEAKEKGRSRIERFADRLTAQADRHLELDEALRVALRENQFVLHFQPIVDMATGRPRGLEALVRWDHPARGLLAPGEWIDVAECSDLIIGLGRWVLEEACREGAAQAAAGRDLTMHVNVSARQLREAGMVSTTRAALAQSGLPASRLVLELTETHLLDVHHSLTRDLQRLRDLGVRLAVDDFGTGYSSLQQLVELPIDALKIDRSFVDLMVGDPRSAAVVQGVLGMAAALGLEVVAEGVETSAQRSALLRAGCTTAQGYLWSRPKPITELVLDQAEPHPVAVA